MTTDNCYLICIVSFFINMSCLHYYLQATDTPESKRKYKLRPTAGRATFVCYMCGLETLSSNLVLVYCCPNPESEPFYPHIKCIKPFTNASPISPQGNFCC